MGGTIFATKSGNKCQGFLDNPKKLSMLGKNVKLLQNAQNRNTKNFTKTCQDDGDGFIVDAAIDVLVYCFSSK